MDRDIVAEFNPKEEILIKDPEELRRKILAIRADGKDNLNILSDYDSTLTKKIYKDEPADHSFNSLEKVYVQVYHQKEIVGNEFVDACTKARAKYLPMELDPTINKEDKQKNMDEWWDLVQSLIIRLSPTKTMIRVNQGQKLQEAVAVSKLYFRNKCPELLQTIATEGLKLHVVSAGITGVVKESFNIVQMQKGLKLNDTLVYVMTPEICDASRDNAVIGFGKPTVTSANKHLCVDHKKYPEIREGTNAILMGDLVEDYLIVKNLKLKEVIGIGFLNVPGEYKEESLDMFMNAYDIVIANDGNMDYPLEVLKSVIGLPLDENYPKQNPQHAKFAKILA